MNERKDKVIEGRGPVTSDNLFPPQDFYSPEPLKKPPAFQVDVSPLNDGDVDVIVVAKREEGGYAVTHHVIKTSLQIVVSMRQIREKVVEGLKHG